jgi:hypothetical protein
MASSLRKALFGSAAWIALAGGALTGCAQEGKTPTCTNNVTDDGMQSDVEDPCHGFAVCVINGDVRPAEDCCVDAEGQPLTGGRLAACLYGYGAFDLPSGEGGAGGGG